MINESMGLHPHKCKICGKKFECHTEYGWKCRQEKYSTKTHYFCSYSCMREYEKKFKRNGPTKREQQFLDLLDSGVSVMDTARMLGVTEVRVRTVRDSWQWRKNREGGL